jgi:hypothetical protein
MLLLNFGKTQRFGKGLFLNVSTRCLPHHLPFFYKTESSDYRIVNECLNWIHDQVAKDFFVFHFER